MKNTEKQQGVESVIQMNQKGMFQRTFHLLGSIRIPWHLYVIYTILGVISAKVGLLYLPYLSELKVGNIQDTSVLWMYIGLMALMVVVGVIENIPSFYANSMVNRNLQNKLIHRALHVPLRSIEAYPASQMVSWITTDCRYADGLITSLLGFVTGLATIYMTTTSMSVIDASLLSIVPAILAYILFSTWLEGKILFIRQKIGKKAVAELTAFFAEHMGYFNEVRQLHAEAEEEKKGIEAIHNLFKVQVYQELLTLGNNIVSGSLSTVVNIVIFVLGVPKVREGIISMPDLVTFQSYVQIAYNSLQSIPSLYTSLMYYNGELFYIAGLMNTKEEVYERKQSMNIPDEDIVFDQVSFAYDEENVIKEASFTIPKEKFTLLVGQNGSGKTTLFKLMQRFYTPNQGEILFGPHKAEEIHLGQWRQSITYVLQEPKLFNSSIRENIIYGMDREVTEEEVRSAAKLACADEFIETLPGGYEFNIGDNGCKLSAGQKQRIAIARAIMLDPAYLLLDEATCNMDIYSEEKVKEALFSMMKGRTTVMISHDMSMLSKADHIVVLREGQVEAEGDYEYVISVSETLKQLVNAMEKGSVSA